jgi:hypothetical protein
MKRYLIERDIPKVGGLNRAQLALSFDRGSEPQFLCPITGYRCEGDLSHLCKDYGCARKGGLSPRSEENL